MPSPALPARPPDDAALRAAALIVDAFDDYNARFSDLTRRARRRFEQRDWRLSQADTVARMELSEACLKETLDRLELLLDERLRSQALWAATRDAYAERIAAWPDREFYQTWFNSLSRRHFLTSGMMARLEFPAVEIEFTGNGECPGELQRAAAGDAPATWRRILQGQPFARYYADPDASAAAIPRMLARRLAAHADTPGELEWLRTVFYRERRAYLVGRVHGAHGVWPWVVAFTHGDDGVRADALVTEPQQLSTLFGFARSHFHADLARVADAVAFLQTLLPHKPRDELYTVLGRVKHGKSERYRAVFRHLAADPDEQLVPAEGQRGMVMSVFTPRRYPVVFKVIRDRFGYGKDGARAQVEAKYRLVLHHDRVGRLVDAQEFRRLRFPLRQVARAVLDELLHHCADSVAVEGDELLVRHSYVQRRLRPLDLYAREAPAEDAVQAVLDYGQAIKDLARSGVFPGDLLLKNFGVSGSRRTLFYDYDELCLLDECRFRRLPPVREEDELRPLDEWLYAARADVFPELFPQFLGLPAPLRETLRRAHGEIFDPGWWQQIQRRLSAGEYLDVPPYPDAARLV